MSGINTLLQTLIGTRLPTVMNASFAFIIPVISIINDFSSREYEDEHEVMGTKFLNFIPHTIPMLIEFYQKFSADYQSGKDNFCTSEIFVVLIFCLVLHKERKRKGGWALLFATTLQVVLFRFWL